MWMRMLTTFTGSPCSQGLVFGRQLRKHFSCVLLQQQSNFSICRCSQQQEMVTLKNTDSASNLESVIQDSENYLGIDKASWLANLNLTSILKTHANVIRENLDQITGSEHSVLHFTGDFYRRTSASHIVSEGNYLVCAGRLRAILTLLVCKALEFSVISKQQSKESSRNDVWEKQRTLVEITEMMYMAFGLHSTVMDIPNPVQILETPLPHFNSTTALNLSVGNNLAALMGDYLLAKCSARLATLKHPAVIEIMTGAISDFAESQFLEMEGFPGLKNITRDMWLRKNRLSLAALLGRSCYCCLAVGGYDESVRNLAYKLGEQFGLLLQATKEIERFSQNIEEAPAHFELISLPVVMAAELNVVPSEKLRRLVTKKDFAQIYNEINCNKKIFRATFAEVLTIQEMTDDLIQRLDSTDQHAVKNLKTLSHCVVHAADRS